MARVVLSTIGSLGDLNPMLALGLELQSRGHSIVINTLSGYEEKIRDLGLGFYPLRPEVDEKDTAMAKRVMDSRSGPEVVIRELMLPSLHDTYQDLSAACEGADLMISGELLFVASSLKEKTRIKWISTSLAPLSMFSSYDPNVYHIAPWLEVLRPLPTFFHQGFFALSRLMIGSWLEPFRAFRRDLGLHENIDPITTDKYSKLLHLAMFSKALAKPQPDWFSPTLQTGFCFYDESDTVKLDSELESFLANGNAPVVFTLGSAAVMDAGTFFEESIAAARTMGVRAVLLYGRDKPVPEGLDQDIVGREFAPYSLIFPRAACVVHQGGVGTTSQALRAGVPQLIVPFSHDQPDNAARCRRHGVAEILDRHAYRADKVVPVLTKLLSDESYRNTAVELKRVVLAESGTQMACDAIEDILRVKS